ncbi:MAG TPA: DUF3102 domain-containing protein [Opitutaceae bacterium]|jgi:hypothetical protein
MPKPSTSTLALISASSPKGDAAEITRLQLYVVEGLRHMQVLRNREATFGLLIGLTLCRMKEAMPHGTFGKWVEQNIAEFGDRYANYLMRLAMTFAEKSRLTKAELIALPKGQDALVLGNLEGEKRAFVEKASGFIGNLSLHELLIKHGIKSAGIKAALGGEGGPNAGVQMDFFADVAERLSGFRSIVTSAEALMRLTPQQLESLDQNMEDIYGQWKRLRGQAKVGAAIPV